MKTCLNCGNELTGNRVKFCSRKCGQCHNAAIHRKPKQRKFTHCEVCGKSLEGMSKSAKLCSDDCRRKKYVVLKPKGKCRVCGVEVHAGRKYCDKHNQYQPVEPTPRECAFCGKTFFFKGLKRYCGNVCQKENQKRKAAQRSSDPEWRSKRNAWKRDYKKRPHVKAKENEFAKEYAKRPERREKKRNYSRRQSKTPKGKVRQFAKDTCKRIFNGYGKETKTAELIGCSCQEVVSHIETQFEPGMSWENHGPDGWHIDHIIPLAAAEGDMELAKMLMHYTNLQPLWAEENLTKSDKW